MTPNLGMAVPRLPPHPMEAEEEGCQRIRFVRIASSLETSLALLCAKSLIGFDSLVNPLGRQN